MTPVTVLLVEDEFLIAADVQDALEAGGFEVVYARDGVRALALLEATPRRFRAVVTDIRLGRGPDGWDVGRRARELVPGLPIVYVSGDSGPDWTSKGVPESLMISKPFATVQIVNGLAGLMNEASVQQMATQRPAAVLHSISAA